MVRLGRINNSSEIDSSSVMQNVGTVDVLLSTCGSYLKVVTVNNSRVNKRSRFTLKMEISPLGR